MSAKGLLRKYATNIVAIAAAALLVGLATAGSGQAQDTTGQLTMGPPQAVQLPTAQRDRASEERQRANFLAAMSNTEEHHIGFPVRQAPVTPGQRRLAIQPPPQAVKADGGITVTSKIDVTAKAEMDYNYVSPIAEASSATAGKNILVTFNWGAAFSTDGGETFTRLDPFSLFGRPESGIGFCCDQLALYVPSHDLMVWLMQGEADMEQHEGNTIRIMVAHGDDIAKRNFHFYDFTPKHVGHPTGEWFDFPDLAYSNGNLFMAFNRFDFGEHEKWLGSSVFRMPLDKLSTYEGFDYQYFNSAPENGEFSIRFTQGAGDTMFWAAAPATDLLLVRQWPDADAQPGPVRLAAVDPYTIPDKDSIAGSEGPNGKPWLDRVDSRLTAGWATDKTIGFAWTSGKIDAQDGGNAYPHPHIRMAILDRAQVEAGGSDPLRPIAQPHIWSSDYAFAYPSAAPDKNGDIGLSMFYGGAHNYPSAAVGVLSQKGDSWTTALTALAEGKNTPRCVKRGGVDDNCGKWGDYMSVRADPDNPDGWYVAAHTEVDSSVEAPPKIAVTYGTFAAK